MGDGEPRWAADTSRTDLPTANQSPGFAKKANAGKPGPKGTAVEKYGRDIAIFRESLKGRSAPALAAKYGLRERQVREVVRRMRDVADSARDPSPEQIVDEVIVRMEDGLRELALAGDDLTGAARVRAIGAYLRGLQRYIDVLRKAGRLPEPDRMMVERDIGRAVVTILDTFRRYDVPVEAQREIRDILDRGRALEAG